MPLSAAQLEIAQSPARFRVAISGRRFGKTYLAQRELARFASQPGRLCWFVAPTRSQGKGIVWDSLKARLEQLRWVRATNETELAIDLRNGSRIEIRSADAYDRMRGYAVDFVVFDEFADQDPAVWTAVRPTLSDREGHVLMIGTPKGMANWSRQMFDMSLSNPDWASFQFTTIQGGRVSEEEIAAAQRDLDERTFRQEYLATFETYQGTIYYAFSRDNVRPWIQPTPRDIMLFLDFNVSPMTGLVAVQHQNQVHVIAEVIIWGSNTDELVQEVQRRWPGHRVTAYPDPAGAQRRTSAGGRTDISILQNAGWTVRYHRQHPPVRDRINAVNSALCNTQGQRRLWIDPACRHLIESLERHCYKEGSQIPDKDLGWDHATDALGYGIEYLMPVQVQRQPQPPRRFTHQTGQPARTPGLLRR